MREKSSKVTTSLEWYLPDFDLADFTANSIKENLIDYIEENKRIIYRQWESDDYENLEKTLSYGSMILRHFVSCLAEDSIQYKLFEIGTLKGAIESFEYLLYEKAAELRFLEENKHHYSSIKHLKEVIQTLETHGSMTQTELCDYLRLRASTLSEAMKKILKTELVLSFPVGKFRLYTLSDTGIKYGRLLRKKKNNSDIDSVFRLLNELIVGIKDVHEVGQVKDELYKTLGITDNVLELHQQSNSSPMKRIYDERVVQIQFDASLNDNRRNENGPIKNKNSIFDFPFSNNYNSLININTTRVNTPNYDSSAVIEEIPIVSRMAG